MADKVDKPKKKAKPKKDEKGVLAALPSTRPERIGSHRATPAAAAAKPAATAGGSTTSARPATGAKPTTTAKRAATGKRKPAAKATSSAARTKPSAARAAAKPAAAKAKPSAAKAKPATARPVRERTYPRPRPVSEGAPGIGTGGYRDQESSESGRPSGVEIASTAVKAASEVAQLGIALGGKALKRVAERLPKP
jgi:hypothetical protein